MASFNVDTNVILAMLGFVLWCAAPSRSAPCSPAHCAYSMQSFLAPFPAPCPQFCLILACQTISSTACRGPSQEELSAHSHARQTECSHQRQNSSAGKRWLSAGSFQCWAAGCSSWAATDAPFVQPQGQNGSQRSEDWKGQGSDVSLPHLSSFNCTCGLADTVSRKADGTFHAMSVSGPTI